tara:strand:- start:7 stop:198 length:192 start_codon:yes stop_codon:yes gene_type:complete
MISLCILLYLVFVVFFISILLHCIVSLDESKNNKRLESNIKQYKKTLTGGLHHDRINEKRKTQ